MNKIKLNQFILKYNLNGNVNSVKWKFSDNKLSTSFVTPDKSLMGNIVVDKFDFEDSILGIYSTDQLQKLLTVLGDDITPILNKVGDKAISLKFKGDSGISVDYQLSDLSVIPEPPTLKRLPDFQTELKLDKKFIDTFIKGKLALSEVDSFTLIPKSDGISAVIGYSLINTNRVTIPVEADKNELTDKVSFNANLFRDVLSANRECTSAILKVSNEGLAYINFKVDNFDSEYYIVAIQDVD